MNLTPKVNKRLTKSNSLSRGQCNVPLTTNVINIIYINT